MKYIGLKFSRIKWLWDAALVSKLNLVQWIENLAHH